MGIFDIKLKDIELKPGMVIKINNEIYVIFPRFSGLAIMAYGKSNYWTTVSHFIEENEKRITCIKDLGTGCLIDDGKVLWARNEELN